MPLSAPLTLAAPGWLIGLLAVGFVLVCLFMMLVILIQKPKGGGLSGAFGGAGGGSAQAAFGAKVGDVLTWLTVSCFVLFLLLAMGLTWSINPTVAEHKAAAAATEGAAGDETAPEEDAEAEAEVGNVDATLDAAKEAAGQTEAPADDAPLDAPDTPEAEAQPNAEQPQTPEAPAEAQDAEDAAATPEEPAAE